MKSEMQNFFFNGEKEKKKIDVCEIKKQRENDENLVNIINLKEEIEKSIRREYEYNIHIFT